MVLYDFTPRQGMTIAELLYKIKCRLMETSNSTRTITETPSCTLYLPVGKNVNSRVTAIRFNEKLCSCATIDDNSVIIMIIPNQLDIIAQTRYIIIFDAQATDALVNLHGRDVYYTVLFCHSGHKSTGLCGIMNIRVQVYLLYTVYHA